MTAREIDIDPFGMPVCPLCDNGMTDSEPVSIVYSFRGHALGLAHTMCVDEHQAEGAQFGAGA